MRDWWQNLDRSRRILVSGAIGLAILAVLIVAVSTKFGAGIGTDGIVYIAAARNFLAGDGISWVGPQADVRPLVIFAPLLPFLLAISSFVSGQDAWLVSRWLNALVFGLNILVLIGFVYWYSRRTWLSLLGGVIFAFSRSMIYMHANVQSEPLFLEFLIASIFLMSVYLESGKPKMLWTSGVMMGLAFLTRYAGIYFIAAGALSLLILKRGTLRDRLRPIFSWAVVNGIAVFGWLLRNQLMAGSGTSRQWAPELPPAELVRTMAKDVSFWFLPEVGPLWVRTAAVVLSITSVVLIWKWMRSRESIQIHSSSLNRTVALMGLMIGVYAAGLVATRSLVVPRIDIIARTLIPVHVLLLLVILFMSSDILHGIKVLSWSEGLRLGFQIALIGFAVSYVLRGLEMVNNLHQDGQGYASMKWQNSPLMNALDLLPAHTPIYTNHVEAIYLYTGRYPYRLPYGCLPEDILLEEYAQAGCQDPEYLQWVETMRQKLRDEQAVIALFGRTYEQVYDPLIPELLEGLEPLSVQGDGAMYVKDVGQWPENPNW